MTHVTIPREVAYQAIESLLLAVDDCAKPVSTACQRAADALRAAMSEDTPAQGEAQ